MSTMEWYLSLSRERGVSARCPFATAERCPRYYLSTWVLNSVDNYPQDEKLGQRWKISELYPKLPDEFPSASGGKALHYGKFCPEISYERFGHFASELTEYYDESERKIGIKSIDKGAPLWKSEWMDLKQRHFTECPLYSPLHHTAALTPLKSEIEGKKEDTPIITLKPTIWGITFDLGQAIKRGRNWLLRRKDKSL